MLNKDLFEVSKNEWTIRKAWLALFIFGIVALALNLVSFIYKTYVYYKQGMSLEVLLPVDKSLSLVFMLLVLGAAMYVQYHCVYKKSGTWLLRIGLYAGLVPTLILDIRALFSLGLSNPTPIILGVKIFTVIWGIAGVYVGFRLLKINRKIVCSRELSDDKIEELNQFLDMPDGDDRDRVYNKLATEMPTISWFIKRLWKRNETLIPIG